MADDSEVQVRFGADTGDVISGTEQVKNSISGISDEVERAEELFKYLGERMLEVFALHEIVDFTEKISEVGENIERMSAMTGLSDQSVQTLGFAMERTGGNAEAAGMMVTRLERNIEQAASGSGKAYDAFQKLGVSLRDLQTLSIDQLIAKTAEGFRNLADPVERASVAADIGGRGFAQMLPAILGNADGLQAFHDKLVTLNDDLSERTVTALAETHGKLVDLRTAAEGAGVQGMLTLKGAIDGVLEGLTYAIVDIGKAVGAFRELQTVLGADLVIACGLFVRAIQDLGAEAGYAADKVVIRWKEVGAIISEVASLHWSEISDVQNEANAEIEASAKKAMTSLAEYQKEFDNLKTSATQAAGAIIAADNAIDKPETAASANRTGPATAPDFNVDLSNIAKEQAIAKANLETQQAILKQEAAYHQITKQQEIEQEKQAVDELFTIDQKALQDKADLYGKGSDEYQKALNQMEVLAAQHNTKIAQLDGQMAQAYAASLKQQEADSTKFFKSIEQASTQMVNGVLQGTQTWQQAMAHLFDNLLLKFIDDFVVKAVLKFAEGQAQQIGLTQAFHAAMSAIGLESAAADATSQHAITAAANTARITADGALTFAGVMANLSPILGPAAAGPAAASESLVLAQIPQASLAVGAWNLPGDMVAQLHAGEMVVPTTFAEGMRNGAALGAGSNYNVSISLNAIDTQTGVQFLKNNAAAIASVMAGQSRNFNSNVPIWKAS